LEDTGVRLVQLHLRVLLNEFDFRFLRRSRKARNDENSGKWTGKRMIYLVLIYLYLYQSILP
jgi:hypothetical protein